MRICIYEDRGVELLEPLTVTRPAFALWCGARTMLERQRAALGADETGLWVRPELVELCRVQYQHACERCGLAAAGPRRAGECALAAGRGDAAERGWRRPGT